MTSVFTSESVNVRERSLNTLATSKEITRKSHELRPVNKKDRVIKKNKLSEIFLKTDQQIVYLACVDKTSDSQGRHRE